MIILFLCVTGVFVWGVSAQTYDFGALTGNGQYQGSLVTNPDGSMALNIAAVSADGGITSGSHKAPEVGDVGPLDDPDKTINPGTGVSQTMIMYGSQGFAGSSVVDPSGSAAGCEVKFTDAAVHVDQAAGYYTLPNIWGTAESSTVDNTVIAGPGPEIAGTTPIAEQSVSSLGYSFGTISASAISYDASGNLATVNAAASGQSDLQDRSLLYGADGESYFDMYQVAQARRVGIIIPGNGPAAYSDGDMYNVATGSLSGFAVDSQGDSAGTTNMVTDGSMSGFVWPSTGTFSTPESVYANNPFSGIASTFERLTIWGEQGSAESHATAANGDTSFIASSFDGGLLLIRAGSPENQNIAGSGNGYSTVNTMSFERFINTGSYQISAGNSVGNFDPGSGSGTHDYVPQAYIDRGPGYFDSGAEV